MRCSFTALKSFMECDYMYYLRYIERIKTVESSASVFGTAIHESLQATYDLNLDSDGMVEFFKARWLELVAEKPDMIWFSDKDFLNKLKLGKNMMQTYYTKYVQFKPKPKATELKFGWGNHQVVKLGRHTLSGVFDQVSATDEVIDFKTGRKPTRMEVDFDLQMTVYSYAYRQLYGKPESNLIIRHLGTMADICTTRDERDFEVLESEVDKIEERIASGLFVRNLSRSCNNCYFLSECLGKDRAVGKWY